VACVVLVLTAGGLTTLKSKIFPDPEVNTEVITRLLLSAGRFSDRSNRRVTLRAMVSIALASPTQ